MARTAAPCRTRAGEKGGDFTIGTIATYSSRSNGVSYVLLFNSHTATNMPDINRKIIQPLVRS